MLAPRILRATAWLTVVLVLVQAGLAGPAWFTGADLFGLHGHLGSAVMVLTLVSFVLMFVTRQGWPIRTAQALAVLATTAQLGLGYAGHRSDIAGASAVHVPLGVALLGLTVAIAVLVTAFDPGSDRVHRAA